MISFIDTVIQQAKRKPMSIVLPEGEDARIEAAAKQAAHDGLAHISVMVTNDEEKKRYAHDNTISAINAPTYEHRTQLAQKLYELRKHKGVSEKQAFEMLENPLILAMMLTREGVFDGVVAGAAHSTADVLRAALQIIKTAPGTSLVSSFFMMTLPASSPLGERTLLFSDCGLNIEPTSEELASIALASAESFQQLTQTEPRVALLSHSTQGSSSQACAKRVANACKLARSKNSTVLIDGELQVDAALIPEIAASKAPQSNLAGRANCLIFPSIDAGNIGYKLVERLAGAQAYGPITQGLAKPVNDLSRGCSARDVYGVIAITALQAQRHQVNLR